MRGYGWQWDLVGGQGTCKDTVILLVRLSRLALTLIDSVGTWRKGFRALCRQTIGVNY